MKKRLKFTFTIVTDNDPESIYLVRQYMEKLEITLQGFPTLLPASIIHMKEEVEKE